MMFPTALTSQNWLVFRGSWLVSDKICGAARVFALL